MEAEPLRVLKVTNPSTTENMEDRKQSKNPDKLLEPKTGQIDQIIQNKHQKLVTWSSMKPILHSSKNSYQLIRLNWPNWPKRPKLGNVGGGLNPWNETPKDGAFEIDQLKIAWARQKEDGENERIPKRKKKDNWRTDAAGCSFVIAVDCPFIQLPPFLPA